MSDFELTRSMIVRSRVIAKGQAIRDVQRLVKTYGGKAALWLKKSSPPLEIAGKIYEYHWHEQHGIGRFEIEAKEVQES